VRINLSEATLRLSPEGSRGIARMGGVVDYTLTVPAAMSIEIGGMYADVTIEGTRGEISVQTVEGNINVKGGGDVLQLQTVNGKISVNGARGRLDLRSVSEDVEVSDVVGDVIAETVSGSVTLSRIDGKRVEAQTVSGDVRFDGTLRADGTYSFLTHSGDMVIGVPENSSAYIRTATGNGDVTASFALPASERSSRRRQAQRERLTRLWQDDQAPAPRCHEPEHAAGKIGRKVSGARHPAGQREILADFYEYRQRENDHGDSPGTYVRHAEQKAERHEQQNVEKKIDAAKILAQKAPRPRW
jgi:hypothetical protein